MSDAFQAGYQAFADTLPPEENPYDDAEQRAQWNEGWEDAKIDKDSQRRSICSED